MSDVFSNAKRSWVMSRVRTRHTEPERLVKKLLHSAGYHVALHVKDLPGRPDLVVRARKTAIYVHGCFWHRHASCDKGRRRPKTRAKFWSEKLGSNVARDRRVARQLRRNGWHVVTIWECETENEERLRQRLRRLLGSLAGH